jgi:type I pantothenate kinase
MDPEQAADRRLSPFVRFSREEWSRLRTPTSLSLSEDDARDLRRISEYLSSEEATEVYLPLS